MYILLLVFQSLLVFVPMFLQDLIFQQRTSMSFAQLGMLQSVIVVGVIIVNIMFVKEFISNKWLFYLLCLINAASFIISSIAYSTPSVMANQELFRYCNIMTSLLVLSNLCVTFYVAVQDMFRIKHDITYSLLGAASIFILIGFIFSFIINLTGSLFVGMVVPADQIIAINNHANKLAFYALASMDSPFDDVNPFIRNILVIESIFAHLFVVIIIGRLLSK